jgi:hypothetical protein
MDDLARSKERPTPRGMGLVCSFCDAEARRRNNGRITTFDVMPGAKVAICHDCVLDASALVVDWRSA